MAIAGVLAGLTSGVMVTAGTVQSLLSAEGMRYPLDTVYKTMCRMGENLGLLRHVPGGFVA